MRSLLRAALALALLAPACGRKDPNALGADVVALVDGQVISRSTFERELARELTSAEGFEPAKRALLRALIERALLVQAARKMSLKVTTEEVNRALLRLNSDYPADTLHQALAQGRLTLAELRQRTADSLLTVKLLEREVYPRVAVTESELRQYFQSHPGEFDEPERVRAAQIVVKAMDEARRLRAQVAAGQRFADLARAFSLSADAKVGGDLGYIARGVLPPELDALAFALPVGEVSDVVATDYGFHLIQILGRRPARRREFPEVRQGVEARRVALKRVQAERDFLRKLEGKAAVRVNSEVLAALTVPGAGR